MLKKLLYVGFFFDEINFLSLIMIGVFGVIGQVSLTISYQLSKASYVAPYSYFYIIFSQAGIKEKNLKEILGKQIL